MTDQKQDPTSSNIIPLPSRHDKNFERYITDYAVTNNLTMDGDVWESALAAAKRLDYAKRSGRAASTPDMTLIPAQPSLFGRFLGLFGRRPQEPHLSEMDDIRAFLAQAPEAAACPHPQPLPQYAARKRAAYWGRGWGWGPFSRHAGLGAAI